MEQSLEPRPRFSKRIVVDAVLRRKEAREFEGIDTEGIAGCGHTFLVMQWREKLDPGGR
jgi:hypothetical protein